MKEKRATDPAFAARDARLRNISGHLGTQIRGPERLASDPSAMSSWLAYGYRRIPSLERAGARMIDHGIAADRLSAHFARRIDAELAQRRRLPHVERQELERSRLGTESLDQGARLKTIATSELRRLRARMRGQAYLMISAAQALFARVHARLEKLAP